MVNNEEIWNEKKSAELFSSIYLDKPELVILCEIKNQLINQKMLDIGVGSGRTTHYFSKFCAEYIGIDYSEEMIKICKIRYQHLKNTQFFFCDARDLNIFSNDTFDFILFSFNGIDCVNHDDRNKIFLEIRRLCKSGGKICFSSHNINNKEKLFSLKLGIDPFKIAYNLQKYVRLKINNFNLKLHNNTPYAMIKDGAFHFKLQHYYIDPSYQIVQLKKYGFENIKIFSLKEGLEIEDNLELIKNEDPWLYYLAECKK